MKLIRTDGTTVPLGEENLVTTPIPQECLDRLRASILADGDAIVEANRRRLAGAAALGPAPVGGEDEYFAAQKRMSER